jgi:hypothetical protein
LPPEEKDGKQVDGG